MMKFEEKFKTEYARLNAAQKKAVDQINGPVMVVAGPGTGKTQLLAMRVANILRQSDAEARGILCLTFTESAAANMTERMVRIFGPAAYQVTVNTFHGLGSEIINRYNQHFYNGAIFAPADELTTGRIIESILSGLPHSNSLAGTMNGRFTHFGAVISTISDLKRAGLLPEESQIIIDQNLAFCNKITPLIQEVFANRVSKATVNAAEKLLAVAVDLSEKIRPIEFSNEPTLAEIFANSLENALSQARSSGKTTALTAWKKQFVATDDAKSLVMRDQIKSQKLAAVNEIYAEYLRQMIEQELYDYADMILSVVHALEKFPSLKSDLQEKYQYILVDEFQDTNDGQMRLLHNLTDYDDQPNIMVVGDDDQAIFRFQGADISNIQSFRDRYPATETVVLTENYRSGDEILKSASAVSGQIEQRLSKIFDLEKTLTANVATPGEIRQILATDRQHENTHVAELIKREIDSGRNPAEIAVIGRRHSDLENMLPFLNEQEISVSYERENNILDNELIEILELMARVVLGIAARDDRNVDAWLVQLLSYPTWGIAARDVWQISLAASRQSKYWLEIMLDYSDQTRKLAEWLIVMSATSQTEPLEIVIDQLLGRTDSDENFHSPLREYYFSSQKLAANPTAFLEFLSNLSKMRQTLRDYQPSADKNYRLRLADFIELVDTYRELGKPLTVTTNWGDGRRVNLLTAHKAKGLEFDSVYIINAASENWGQKSRSRPRLISFPANMPFQIAGDNSDEQLRLLFVAWTRSKHQLTVSSHQIGDSSKQLLPLEYLTEIDNFETQILPKPTVSAQAKQLETAWYSGLTNIENPAKRLSLNEVLADRLARYKLSATDLNNFIGVDKGGPANFLMQSLLRFPNAKSPAAAFGTAMHTALQRAHIHLTARSDNKPLEDIIGDFESSLRDAPLSERDFEFYLTKGIDALKVFYDQRIESFDAGQIVEYNFHSENVAIGDVRLTGKIDLIDLDNKSKSLFLTDYKTGKAPRSWTGKTDYEKVKLHKYRQQLMIYKMLVEKSNRFRGFAVEKGVLEFVEPLGGQITQLEMIYDSAEMDNFIDLLKAVWTRIMSLDLPPVDDFSPDFQGILDFEAFLLKKP